MLKDTSYRDRNQVVSAGRKATRRYNHNILMVQVSLPCLIKWYADYHSSDQLWLWRIHVAGAKEDIIITSFPSREGALYSKEDGRVRDDLQGSVLKETDRARIQGTDDLVARIVEACCKTMIRRQDFDSVRFLERFEISIGEAVSGFLQQIRTEFLTCHRKRI